MTSRTATPFVVVADQRTGSTLLATSLDTHPRIRCYGELFHSRILPDNGIDGFNRLGSSSRTILRRAMLASGARAVGFKAMVFLPLPSAALWQDAWERIRELPDLHVIYLTRQDRLAQYASLRIASCTGVFHPDDNDSLYQPRNRPAIHIDPTAFRSWMRKSDSLMQERRQALGGLPYLDIAYETLTTAWEDTTTRVQEFLQVDVQPLAPQKQKQERRPLSEVIANFDEVAGFVQPVTG